MAAAPKKSVVIVGESKTMSPILTKLINSSEGANRGIGLKLAQALAGDWTVTGSVRPQTLADWSTREVRHMCDATYRPRLTSMELEETGAKVLTMELTDEETIIAAAKAYGVGPLDMLINCAGEGFTIDWYRWRANGSKRCWTRY